LADADSEATPDVEQITLAKAVGKPAALDSGCSVLLKTMTSSASSRYADPPSEARFAFQGFGVAASRK